MAKPFTGPDPKKNKIVAAIKVVIFASKTAVFAFLYPLSKAKILFFSVFTSSFILSKIKTLASTAMPTVKIIPAIPGRVKVASNKVKIPTNKNKLIIKATLAIKPKIFYLYNIKNITKRKPITRANIPELIES